MHMDIPGIKHPRKQNKPLFPREKQFLPHCPVERGLEWPGLIPNSCWDEGGQMAQLSLEWDGQRGAVFAPKYPGLDESKPGKR